MSFNATHPELGAGELFLGNMDDRDFTNCGWTTKRRGRQSYDRYGVPYNSARPVFVMTAEIQKHPESKSIFAAIKEFLS